MSSKIARQIATVGGVGYLPIAPGTWGSLVACIPALVFSPLLSWWIYLGLFLVSLALGVWAIPKVQGSMGHDPGPVVIDEVAGMCVVCLVPDVRQSTLWLIIGFLIFRVFDIVKLWPASFFDNRTEGWAVMADDIVAGLYTVAVLILAIFTLQVGIIWLESL